MTVSASNGTETACGWKPLLRSCSARGGAPRGPVSTSGVTPRRAPVAASKIAAPAGMERIVIVTGAATAGSGVPGDGGTAIGGGDGDGAGAGAGAGATGGAAAATAAAMRDATGAVAGRPAQRATSSAASAPAASTAAKIATAPRRECPSRGGVDAPAGGA